MRIEIPHVEKCLAADEFSGKCTPQLKVGFSRKIV